MRKSVMCLASLLAIGFAADARAQFAPLGGKLIVSVNGGIQPGSDTLTNNSVFTIYDEQASIDASQKIEGGGLWDFGASYRVRPRWGVGIAYTMLDSTNPATITAAIPHPLFFDQPRTLTASADDLIHKESALHLQAVYFFPLIENVDVAFTAGPTFFSVRQQFARNVSFDETPPDFASVTASGVDVVSLEESAVGINLGADVTYSFTSNIGAGALLRYTRGSVDFAVADGQEANVKAGNFQLGVGLRIKF
jgi:Outer membrane protein beta-barrel domain